MKDKLIERLNTLAEERLKALDEGRFEDWDALSDEATLIEQSFKDAGYNVSMGGDRKHYLTERPERKHSKPPISSVRKEVKDASREYRHN